MNPMQIGKSSLQTIWKHKSLWLFGFFVAASGGGAGGGRATHLTGAGGQSLPSWAWPLLAVGAVWAIALGVVLNVVSEAALIDGARRSRDNQPPALREVISAGFRHFWKVLKVKLVASLALLLGAVVVAVPLALAAFKLLSPLAAGLLTAPLVVAGVPTLLSVYFVYLYALRVAVVDDVGMRPAFAAARRFLSGRVLDSVKLMVLNFAGQAAGGAAMVVALLPGAVVGGLVYLAAGLVPALVAGGVVAAPLAAVAVGAIGAFRSTVWTLGFLEGRAEELAN